MPPPPVTLQDAIVRDGLADHLRDLSKGDSEPMPLSEKKLCLLGRNWVYIFDLQESEECVPAQEEPVGVCHKVWDRATTTD